MRLILGLDAPTAGDVIVNGKHYRDHKAPLHEVGALLEARSVHTGRSAYYHLLALAQTHGIGRKRVDELVDLVGLHEVARKRAGKFSLGMGQRLGIAKALLGDPSTLLLDEPANGLDPEGIHWMRNLLKGLAAEGRAVFVSSHLMSEMALTAEHLIVIGEERRSPMRVPTSSFAGTRRMSSGFARRVFEIAGSRRAGRRRRDRPDSWRSRGSPQNRLGRRPHAVTYSTSHPQHVRSRTYSWIYTGRGRVQAQRPPDQRRAGGCRHGSAPRPRCRGWRAARSHSSRLSPVDEAGRCAFRAGHSSRLATLGIGARRGGGRQSLAAHAGA